VRSPPKIFRRVRVALRFRELSPVVRRVLIGFLGGIVFCIGVALLVLPGPAFIVIPLGLLILATEFVWIRRMLQRARRTWKQSRMNGSARPAVRAKPSEPAQPTNVGG